VPDAATAGGRAVRCRLSARPGRAAQRQARFRPRRAAAALAVPLLAAALFVALPAGRAAYGALSDYEPDIDVSAGTFNYFFNEGDGAPDIATGVFFSGYLSMKSPFFTFFFNTKNFYSTYEAGVAYNRVRSDEYYVLSIPATVDLSYRIPLSRRLSVYPFVGTGLDAVDNRYNGTDNWNFYLLFDGGLEFKYGLWRDTYLKLKVTYGVVFVDTLTSGYAYFLRVRFPVPFIP
jgi:hypothetical protein